MIGSEEDIMKKKAGIITIVDFTNYGNRLQNYAVSETLKKLGVKSETLFFTNANGKARVKQWIKYSIKNIPGVIELNILLRGKASIKHIRYLNFDKFSRKNIKLRTVDKKNRNKIDRLYKKYDYFAIGSDQIWNPNYGYATDFDFASFAMSEQKICFAPSFGVDEIPDQFRETIKNNLQQMNYIAVREKSGARIVKDLVGKDSEVLLDPTMLLYAEEWEKVAEVPHQVDLSEKYIFSYFLGTRTEEQEKRIEHIKNQYGLKEYTLLDKRFPELYVAGPGEFIELIKNATLVCTDSFHASVFSILFQKPFIVFQRDGDGAGISSRLDTLLETFKLTSRKELNVKEEDLLCCNFEESNEILEKERERCLDFFKRAMNI